MTSHLLRPALSRWQWGDRPSSASRLLLDWQILSYCIGGVAEVEHKSRTWSGKSTRMVNQRLEGYGSDVVKTRGRLVGLDVALKLPDLDVGHLTRSRARTGA
jgi:hypothetical protein